MSPGAAAGGFDEEAVAGIEGGNGSWRQGFLGSVFAEDGLGAGFSRLAACGAKGRMDAVLGEQRDLDGLGECELPDEAVAAGIASLPAAVFANGELNEAHGKTVFEDFGVGGAGVGHVGMNAVGAEKVGACARAAADSFVVAAVAVAKDKVVHSALAAGG